MVNAVQATIAVSIYIILIYNGPDVTSVAIVHVSLNDGLAATTIVILGCSSSQIAVTIPSAPKNVSQE